MQEHQWLASLGKRLVIIEKTAEKQLDTTLGEMFDDTAFNDDKDSDANEITETTNPTDSKTGLLDRLADGIRKTLPTRKSDN